MKYWTYVPFTSDELEELADADLPPGLHERVERYFKGCRAAEESMEAAQELSARLAWNAEMDRLMRGPSPSG